VLVIVKLAQTEGINVELLSDLDKLMTRLSSKPPETGIAQGGNNWVGPENVLEVLYKNNDVAYVFPEVISVHFTKYMTWEQSEDS
jgi:hypothetical protein